MIEAGEVARRARELMLAVSRLEEARLEAGVAADRVALEQAGRVIENARRLASRGPR